ncbi:helix-turn-helix domain-containing protein [Ruegeria pomeroyi]|nr:helix-turn-helix domain-containing protein [Ruegeria pomeroyi]
MGNWAENAVPGWVPESAQRYLAHTEAGFSIRDLARGAGCHASTVLRQIRRVEMRRDDPLVDAALEALAATHFPPLKLSRSPVSRGGDKPEDTAPMTKPAQQIEETPDAATFDLEATRILRRLCESGAVLAVAEDMDKAVVVRDDGKGGNTRTAVVSCAMAQALALKDWIACDKPGRISRYYLTTAGRGALGRLLAEAENRARAAQDGFAEAQSPFAAQHRVMGEKTVAGEAGERPRRVRYNMAESPLIALARRKDRDGQPFLDDTLVRAGERLREDFELAQMGPNIAQNWDRFLTGGARGGFHPDSGVGHGPEAARDRVARALSELGPGLSDVALRCCCYLEGLELAEKRMGWSARSGKIVLRIALQRLKRHYEEQSGRDRLIG